MIGFAPVWQRIEGNSGAIFRQIRGGAFTYSIQSGCLIPDRTNRQIPKSEFEKAFSLVPFENTKPLQRFQGPSYIFAVLMDPRIRAKDW